MTLGRLTSVCAAVFFLGIWTALTALQFGHQLGHVCPGVLTMRTTGCMRTITRHALCGKGRTTTPNSRNICTCVKCATGIGPQKAPSLTSTSLAPCPRMKRNPGLACASGGGASARTADRARPGAACPRLISQSSVSFNLQPCRPCVLSFLGSLGVCCCGGRCVVFRRGAGPNLNPPQRCTAMCFKALRSALSLRCL